MFGQFDLDMEKMQRKLSRKVQVKPLGSVPELIAGFDIQECGNGSLVGVLVVFEMSTKHIVEVIRRQQDSAASYQPGFLSLRELPLFLACWKEVDPKPDVVVFDGHGLMHPRGLGMASHAGIKIDHPTFGVAKNPLVGEYDEPGEEKGSWTPVTYREQTIGACLRTKDGVNPVFVSVGHRVSLDDAISLSLEFSEHRIPELTRRADNLARKYCREMGE